MPLIKSKSQIEFIFFSFITFSYTSTASNNFFLYFGGRQLDKILQYPLTASRTNQKELNEYKFLYQQMKSE